MSEYRPTQHSYGGIPLYPDNGAPQPMAGGGMTYVPKPLIGPRKAHWCIANEETCKGPKAKGTELCIGHLKGQMKLEREAELDS